MVAALLPGGMPSSRNFTRLSDNESLLVVLLESKQNLSKNVRLRRVQEARKEVGAKIGNNTASQIMETVPFPVVRPSGGSAVSG